jgi:hypothetical protein
MDFIWKVIQPPFELQQWDLSDSFALKLQVRDLESSNIHVVEVTNSIAFTVDNVSYSFDSSVPTVYSNLLKYAQRVRNLFMLNKSFHPKVYDSAVDFPIITVKFLNRVYELI